MHFVSKLALRTAAVGVAVAAVIVPFAAQPAAAATPTLTATPSTGLHNADVVSVSGTGFAVSSAFTLVECSSLASTGCDTSNVVTGTTGADGTIAPTNITVHTGAIGAGTCPTSADGTGCYLIATTDPTDPTAAGFTAITFAPAAAITSNPSTGVKNGQTVKVSGSGFPAKAEAVAIVECASASNAKACDTANVELGQTKADGSFTNLPLKVVTGTVGNGTCKPGGTCYIVATTDVAGMGADKSQDAVTTIKFAAASTSIGTKTVAKFAKKTHKITGSVTSASGKGLRALRVKLDIKSGKHWKPIANLRTHKAGKFASNKIKKSGTYRIKTLKQKTYRASVSHPIKVNV
jgi:hypothetical protein